MGKPNLVNQSTCLPADAQTSSSTTAASESVLASLAPQATSTPARATKRPAAPARAETRTRCRLASAARSAAAPTVPARAPATSARSARLPRAAARSALSRPRARLHPPRLGRDSGLAGAGVLHIPRRVRPAPTVIGYLALAPPPPRIPPAP